MNSRRLSVALLGFGLSVAGPWACSSSNGPVMGTGGSSSSSSHAASVTSGVGGSGPSNVGLSCTADADCGTGLTCVLPNADNPVFGGGPANGYCSASCATDGDCPGDSMCVTDGMNHGQCVLSCTLGPQLMFLNDPIAMDGKCQQRNDVRCQALNATTNVCVPTCGEDSQCPTGRKCDPRLSVCVTQTSMGLPEGSACDPMAMTPQCAGECVSFTGSNVTLCTSACELGGAADPTVTPNCGGVKKGLCAYSPMGNGAGDFGFCAPACNKHDDCQVPNFWCFPVNGLTGSKGITNGFCFGTQACPNGAADCASAKGTTCTQTAYGPQCLEGNFPLGSAAPDAGTGDAGTGSDAGDAGSTTDAGSDAGSTTDAGAGDAGDGGDGG